jgi:ribosome recycling factor
MSTDFSQFEKKIEEVKSWLEGELAKIRSGRVSGNILDGITAQVYGQSTPIDQLASIGNEGPRTLRVDVYDSSQIDAVKKAIQQADLGAAIAPDSEGVRLNFPEMTEENKKEAMSRANEKLEKARVSLREARNETKDRLQTAETDGDLSEDELHRAKKRLEEKMQSAQDDLEQMVADKETALQS